jgi:hypothetical protein
VRLLPLCLGLILCSPLAWAQNSLPKPYGGGDYWLRIEEPWLDWEVVCPELAGRLTPSWPANEEEPGALLEIDWNLARWPLVKKFAKGERLRARPDSVGGIMIKDIDGSTWMKVELEGGQLCFVRCNARYLRPINSALQTASLKATE